MKLSEDCFSAPAAASRPTRGAWIEIHLAVFGMSTTIRRAPHGARGLKCGANLDKTLFRVVAPHTGRVD